MPPRPASPAPAPLASLPPDRRCRHTRTSPSHSPRAHRPASATGLWACLTLSPTDGTPPNRQIGPAILNLTRACPSLQAGVGLGDKRRARTPGVDRLDSETLRSRGERV